MFYVISAMAALDCTQYLLYIITKFPFSDLVAFVCFRYVYMPFGLLLGIKGSKPKKAEPNETLERAYKHNGKMKHKEIIGLAKQLDWTERQVERWLRLRRAQERPSTLIKFSENG